MAKDGAVEGSSARGATQAPAPPEARAAEQPLLVRASDVAKAFGPTQALRRGSFELRPGEVHALVGENGSGKSTLVKILSGVHAPDAGTIEIGGEPVQALRTPRAAQQLGVVTVFQEVLVAEARSVLDNLWIGVDTLLRTRVPVAEKRARAREVLAALLDRPPALDTAVEELSLSDRQACCIARALLRRPRILILDEATSALDVATRDRLFALTRELTAGGAGIVFITHRMDEVSELGDRITVMRSGTTVATLERNRWSAGELVQLMTGSEQLTDRVRERRGADAGGAPVLSVRGMRLHPRSDPFDVEIRPGELLGVAGLEGHGQDAFLEALRGAPTAAGEVVRHRDGREVRVRSAADAEANGIAYVPRERGHAIFRWMSIRENFALPTLTRDRRLGWLRPASSRRRLAHYVEQLKVVLGNQEDRITTLSGGNQQKVVIARWLAAEPRVLLLNDPTRGIDIGAKHDLYELLVRLADEGLAVVMLSTEVDEHVELMDRVLVFREQVLFREIDRAQLSRRALVSAFFGETVEGDDEVEVDDVGN